MTCNHLARIKREGGYFCPTREKLICRACFVSCVKSELKCEFLVCKGKFFPPKER